MRHGKTDWNARYRTQGRTDIPLNDEGRQMAFKAREKYRGLTFARCYSSPLSRAYETAEIFLEGQNVPIIKDERLAEMSFGICEGIENVFEKPDCPIYNLFQDPVHYTPPEGAESFEELYARTGAFVSECLPPESYREQNILILGHGAMNLSIINRFYNIPLERFWERMHGNCELISVSNEPS